MAKLVEGILVTITDNDAAGDVEIRTNYTYESDGDIVPVYIKQGTDTIWMDKDTALMVAYTILDEAGVDTLLHPEREAYD